jgi:hypothetical protein
VNWTLVAPGALLTVAGLSMVGQAAWKLYSPQRTWQRERMDRATGRADYDLGWLRRKRQTMAVLSVAGLVFVGLGVYWMLDGLG